jgi:D-inositol-3-phosphate glycosyltransferase
MKRIAQISYHTSPIATLGGRVSGGMNVYVLELSRELARLGNHVDIFTRREDAGAAVQELEPGLRLVQVESGPAAPLDKEDLPAHLGEFIENTLRFAAGEPRSYDVVHSHYWQSARAATHIARSLGAPHVTMFHTLGEVKNRARISEAEPRERIRHERNAVRRADAIVTASDHERAVLARYYDADEARMHTIPCGIDLELFHPRDRAAARRALGIEADVPVLLWVGRLEKLKGVDILIQALAEVETPDTRLLIVGGDAQADGLRAELEEQARTAGVHQRVRFEGAVPHDQLPYYYSAADICVVPSYYESFGLVAVEALACGTPVVASRVGGLVSTITDGVNGYLIPWRCPGPFAEKLDVLLNNPALRGNFSRAGRRSVERFRWRTVALAVAALYDRVEARHQAGPNEAAYDAFGKEAFESALLARGGA